MGAGGLGRQVCQSSGSPVECGQWEPQGGAAGEHGQWEPREGVGSFLRNLVGVQAMERCSLLYQESKEAARMSPGLCSSRRGDCPLPLVALPFPWGRGWFSTHPHGVGEMV